MIDKGGAEIRRAEAERRDRRDRRDPFRLRSIVPDIRTVKEGVYAPVESATRAIKVTTRETHDGEECSCITATHTLLPGDKIELTHTCHDGRVDRLEVKFEEIV